MARAAAQRRPVSWATAWPARIAYCATAYQQDPAAVATASAAYVSVKPVLPTYKHSYKK